VQAPPRGRPDDRPLRPRRRDFAVARRPEDAEALDLEPWMRFGGGASIRPTRTPRAATSVVRGGRGPSERTRSMSRITGAVVLGRAPWRAFGRMRVHRRREREIRDTVPGEGLAQSPRVSVTSIRRPSSARLVSRRVRRRATSPIAREGAWTASWSTSAAAASLLSIGSEQRASSNRGATSPSLSANARVSTAAATSVAPRRHRTSASGARGRAIAQVPQRGALTERPSSDESGTAVAIRTGRCA
jgi:hypothetical protein